MSSGEPLGQFPPLLESASSGSLLHLEPEIIAPDQLVEEAWAMISEALTAGRITLASGKTYDMDMEQIVALAKWLAMAKVKKPRGVVAPEGFTAKKTGGGSDTP